MTITALSKTLHADTNHPAILSALVLPGSHAVMSKCVLSMRMTATSRLARSAKCWYGAMWSCGAIGTIHRRVPRPCVGAAAYR